uniref:Uncharacterized protein n=1 Tax=Leishmania guyanensis TaxID=5670 RepID=A0A1E1IRS7_LEIGU|nr:hypothetical protein, conserved [Leishmania guyanensis]
MATIASKAAAVTGAAGLGTCMDSELLSLESPTRANQRGLKCLDRSSAATVAAAAAETAKLSTSASAMESFGETALTYLGSNDAAPPALAQALSSRAARQFASWAVAAGSKSAVLLAAAPILPDDVVATKSAHDLPTKEGVRRLAIGSSGVQEDDTAASGGGFRSCTSSVVIVEATPDNQPASALRTLSTAASKFCLPGESPQRTPPSRAQELHSRHSKLPSSCLLTPPIQSPQEVSCLSGSGGCVSFSPGGASDSTGSTAAATSALNNTTPNIFPASHWIQATLDLTATHPRGDKETMVTFLPPSQSVTLKFRKDALAAQTAVSLHERRVAAVLHSQKEMREFTAIMRRVEAKGGANASRQRQKRQIGSVAAAANGTVAAGRVGSRANNNRRQQLHPPSRRETGGSVKCDALLHESASHRSNSPYGNSSTTSRPSGQLPLPGRAEVGGCGRSSMDSAESYTEEVSFSSVFSEMPELDGDGSPDATASSQLHRTGGPTSVQSTQRCGHLPGGGGATAVAQSKMSAAADNMARLALYKLRDRTARGLITLQHQRVAHMRAGTPVLERQMQASRQRLLHAYRAGAGKGRGAGAQTRAALHEAIRDAAAAEDRLVDTTALPDEAPVHFQIPMPDDLAELKVSWRGIPDAVGSDDDSDNGDSLNARQLSLNMKCVTQLPKVGGEADRRGKDSVGCPRIGIHSGGSSGGGGRQGTDSRCVGAETPVVPIAAPDQRAKSLTSTSSLLSNGTLRPANVHTSASDLYLGSDELSLPPVADSATCFTAGASVAAAALEAAAEAKDEQRLRNELQRRLAQANESTVYGLDGALRGARDGCPFRTARGAAAAATIHSSVAGGGADAAPHSARKVKLNRHRLGESAAPPNLQPPARLAAGQSMPGQVPLVRETCNVGVSVPASVAVAGVQERRTDPSFVLPDPGGHPQQLKHQGGVQLGSGPATLLSTQNGIVAALLSTSLPPLGGSTTPATQSRAVVAQSTSPVASALGAQASAGGLAVAAALLPQPRRPRRNSSFLKRKKRHRRKPLTAAIGVGEHASALLQQELLVTRWWELAADQEPSHDIECTCATLQRLRPLRDQLMERDMCAGTRSPRAAKRGAEGPEHPLLLMRDPVLGSRPATPPDTALATPMPLPNVPLNASVSSTAVTGTMTAPSPPPRRTEADAAVVRSHLAKALLRRQRQLIYNEAVRLDTTNRLEAHAAYLDALTQLAHKHVSAVSWPAVSALMDELRKRLQREAQLTTGAPAATGDGAASELAAQATVAPPSSFSTASSLSTTSVVLHATRPALPPPPSAQQYGGLQQLIATHFGVLELTQWAVQELLQHLAALYRIPLSLLHEWIAEQQRCYSRSYNYEERFLAVDRTIVGRAVTSDTVLRLTLHRCRRPPLAPLQGPSRAAGSEAMVYVSHYQQEQQPVGQGEGLYYIRVRSAVQSVASTAVPLSSTAATSISGTATSMRDFPASFSEGVHVLAMGSLSAIASEATMLQSSSSAKVLNFFGQTLIVHLISTGVTASGRSKGPECRTATKRATGYHSDGSGVKDTNAEVDDSVLAVELMQAGATSPLACGKLDLYRLGYNAGSTNHGGGRVCGQNIQITLRRKGYRSAELKATLEIL